MSENKSEMKFLKMNTNGKIKLQFKFDKYVGRGGNLQCIVEIHLVWVRFGGIEIVMGVMIALQ